MIAPNKSLGQHFLINEGVVEKIANAVQGLAREGNKKILEIGPGPGVLTRALLARKLKLTAIEVDGRMVEKLRSESEFENLNLIHGDALKISFAQIFGAQAQDNSWVLCGNLPYNVGTEILFRFLEQAPQVAAFVCMHQKEVVQRLMSRGGSKDYGLPSLKWAWATEFLKHFWVSPGSFHPPPKVDSGVFVARRLSQPLADPLERGGLYDEVSKLASRAFSQRRKMLRGAFPALKDHEWGRLRAEDLSPEDFLQLPTMLN